MRTVTQDAPPAGSLRETTALRRVLIIEDDEEAGHDLETLLRKEPNLEATAVANPVQALELLEQESFNIVITDLRMPDVDGLEVIRRVQGRRLPATVIVLTAYGGIDEAVAAVRLGAYDFLTKPIDLPRLRLVLDRALRERALQDELCRLREQLQSRYCFHNVLSRSPKMHAIFELINQVAATSATVLIEGETGTGKEQLARAIHNASGSTRKGPFVAVNCAAVPENLLESELFGHEKGSFTGALGQRKGRFEQADGGTLFLDEVGDIPPSMQVKLLRVLQERIFERVGGTTPIKVDVRIIAATNRDLRRMVKKGEFREDLYYRLDVVRIEVPPLRERPEDIPILAAHFARKHSPPDNPVSQLSAAAIDVLQSYRWPGNVRELENVIERACVTARGATIEPDDLPGLDGSPAATPGSIDVDLRKPLRQLLAEIVSKVEREYLLKALRKTRGHVGKAARLCGYSRRSITGKLAEYHIDRNEFTDL
jgi:DNA-binding NtrC family response regulator